MFFFSNKIKIIYFIGFFYSRTISEMAGCLSYTLESEQTLVGQIWNANEQCKLKLGPSASFCHQYSSQICSVLYCRESLSSKTCVATSPAANGTVCDNKKVFFYKNFSLDQKISLKRCA